MSSAATLPNQLTWRYQVLALLSPGWRILRRGLKPQVCKWDATMPVASSPAASKQDLHWTRQTLLSFMWNLQNNSAAAMTPARHREHDAMTTRQSIRHVLDHPPKRGPTVKVDALTPSNLRMQVTPWSRRSQNTSCHASRFIFLDLKQATVRMFAQLPAEP